MARSSLTPIVIDQSKLPSLVAPPLSCRRCKGEGKTHSPAFSFEGVDYPARSWTCPFCAGKGMFGPIDLSSILGAIAGRKGLCSQRPAGAREYYVWRLARFHGGADVTMPIVAMSEAEGDPFTKELDVVADLVATSVFGTDRAAAYRWGRLLHGGCPPAPVGLPASAYENGPVLLDADKPDLEFAEMR